MKNLIIIALLAISAFASCKKEELKSANIGCTPYVDLYFYNYDSLKNDPIRVEEYTINGDCLQLKVSYGGCTTDHKIDLIYLHPKCGTPPLPPPEFEIRHDSKGEGCKMLVTETRSFDLTPLRNPDASKVSFTLTYPTDAENFTTIDLVYNY